MIIMGTHVNEDLFKGIKLLPGNYLLQNWKTVLATDFLKYYWNSLYIAVLATVGGTLISALTGYAFAKYQFKMRSFLLLVVIGMLAIPNQLGLTGLVMEFKWLGWNNTHWPLIVLPMMNAFTVYWLTQFIAAAIPDEIMESCRMDGCSEFRMYWQIVLPNIVPALVTTFLIMFLGSWNNYLIPLVILNKDKLYTVPLAISKFSAMYRTDYAAEILALCLSTLPIIILFAVFSKSLIRGLMAGSLKG
jgi:cellobiose transport system permease protein